MRTDKLVVEGRGLRVVRGGVTILDVPRFELEEGDILGLIGPNGAGKTTLLQALAYLTRPFEGSLYSRGRKVGSDYPVLDYRRTLAMAFQEPLLFDATVFDNVASGLRIRGRKRREVSDTVAEYLDLFGISHLRNRSARNLSGGEAQRTSLARAFAVRPEVILLDEPFASLDPGSRELLIDDIQTILRRTRTTAVLVTHDLMEALRLCHKIAVMDRGGIRQSGPLEDVMNKPADEIVASLVGIGTIISGRVTENRGDTFVVSASGREIESVGDLPVGESVGICIRPENVTLSMPSEGFGSEDPIRTSARNVFPGVIARITPMGFFQKVYLDCGFRLVSYITRQSREDLRLEEGGAVVASFKATAIHVVRKPLSQTQDHS